MYIHIYICIHTWSYLILQDYIHHWNIIDIFHLHPQYKMIHKSMTYSSGYPVMCVVHNMQSKTKQSHGTNGCTYRKILLMAPRMMVIPLTIDLNHPRWLFGILSINSMTFLWQHGIHLGVATIPGRWGPPPLPPPLMSSLWRWADFGGINDVPTDWFMMGSLWVFPKIGVPPNHPFE